uniref:Uncharacterized protein n=1 Tax=Hyaloperonospora arabidopsidis (strain Emoy2) TaxID=559515 RepID=M4BNB7_HYAAE
MLRASQLQLVVWTTPERNPLIFCSESTYRKRSILFGSTRLFKGGEDAVIGTLNMLASVLGRHCPHILRIVDDG